MTTSLVFDGFLVFLLRLSLLAFAAFLDDEASLFFPLWTEDVSLLARFPFSSSTDIWLRVDDLREVVLLLVVL